MKTYYFDFEVVPSAESEHFATTKGAIAACWVIENEPIAAISKASFFISNDEWEILRIKNSPVEVTEHHFQDRDIGLEQYKNAQKNGFSIFYADWAKDGTSTLGPLTLKNNNNFQIGDFLKEQKRLKQLGRCLHYDSNLQCQKIINAHSIQKNQSLSSISNDGHVYSPSTKHSNLKKTTDQLVLKRKALTKFRLFSASVTNTTMNSLNLLITIFYSQQVSK